MTWIKTIEPGSAEGQLAKIYRQVAGPDGQIDQILQAHSLRPHTLAGHMTLYKNVLHNSANQLPVSLLEASGVLVSSINQCEYCVRHHSEGLRRALNDASLASKAIAALQQLTPEQAYSGRDLALLQYAAKLTLSPSNIRESDIQEMREAGAHDGEILEMNQVSAYFAYANRTVLGLGVSLDGEVLGLAPRSEAGWNHE